MLTIDALKEFGCNTEEGLGRCMGNEAFYFRLIRKEMGDPNFEKLAESVAAGDLEHGFETAHALKGVLGNLSLTPLFEPASAICEGMRVREEKDYAPLLAELLAKKKELEEICAE